MSQKFADFSHLCDKMPKFDPPSSFNFSKPTEWPEWKRRFERFRIATKLDKDTAAVQVNSLVYAMGPEADHVYCAFSFDSDEDSNDYKKVLQKFDDYFIPKRNITYERAQFYKRNQKEGETVESFIRSLYELAEHCQFGETKSEQIRDRIVIGILDSELSQKMQLKTDLTLETAIELARHSELVKTQNAHSSVQPQASGHLDSVSHGRGKPGKPPNKSHFQDSRNPQQQSQKRGQYRPRGGYRGRGRGQSQSYTQGQGHENSFAACDNCGLQHAPERQNCPARNVSCNACKKMGHYARKCRSSTRNVQEVAYYHDATEPPEPLHVYLGSVNTDTSQQNEEAAWYETLDVQGYPVKFKLDSGADVSVISEDTWKLLKPRPKLTQVKSKLVSPGGPLQSKGQFIAKSNDFNFRVIVVSSATENLLSRTAAVRMGFIQRLDNVIDPELFADIGLVDCQPVKIVLRNDAQPFSVSTARRVPIPIESAVRSELQRMEQEGIVQKITEPTPWCSPMVPVVKKNGKIRICVDLKRLNQSVAREKHTLPVLDDVLHRLAKSTVFTKLDASSGFWQIPLEDDSAKLTTFITPFEGIVSVGYLSE